MTSPDEFDPQSHTVDDVLAYLASAEPAEQARVIAAERDGKARKSVLAAEDPEAPEPGAAVAQGVGPTSLDGYWLAAVDENGDLVKGDGPEGLVEVTVDETGTAIAPV